jgi:adhesin transport system membrane fusion protein
MANGHTRTIGSVGELGTLPAIELVRAPHATRILASILTLLFLVIVAALIFTPWQQSVPGKGRVIALTPVERQQSLEAPVEGRIVKWHVVEGTRVKAGDVVVEMADQDPNMLARLSSVREAVDGRFAASSRRVDEMNHQILQLEESRRNAISAARSRVQMAIDRLNAAEQNLEAARARQITAELNRERQKKLFDKGLTSQRNVELAQLEMDSAAADLLARQAALNATKNDQVALEADLLKVTTDQNALIRSARASLESAKADVQSARAESERASGSLSRQSTQLVRAPRDGTIFRLFAQPGSELLKSGEKLADFVPDVTSPVVELFLNGNDVPLVRRHDLVRLQFNGWPAIQFVGWPSVAVGTFGGRVILVDSTDNGKGQFRVLVEPDPADSPWPSKAYLRQGVQANGWVLLKQVPLGFELWRQFNGFPPVIAEGEPGGSK